MYSLMQTTLIRSFYNIKPEHQGGVLTIGNFDGVHLGHQQLVANVIAKARQERAPSIVMTFEPHPFEFFAEKKLTIPRITRLREKFIALSDCGIDNVIIVKFNQRIASIPASDFLTEILYKYLRPVHILIGDDFRFGYQRQGDFGLLQKKGPELGFSVEAMPSVMLEDERISSTRVRKALAAGDLALAARLLGHPYSMLGRVRGGDKLGRQLGFPTANIYLHRQLTPVKGVYAVLMHGITEKPLIGAANIGTRPTVNGTRTLLEVHLLNFNQDIYGRYVRVEFCKKLRDEVWYPSLNLLKEQIAKDVEATRDYFLTVGGYERL
jgi:riboflavin kinase/FMN adenylyltransferase